MKLLQQWLKISLRCVKPKARQASFNSGKGKKPPEWGNTGDKRYRFWCLNCIVIECVGVAQLQRAGS